MVRGWLLAVVLFCLVAYVWAQWGNEKQKKEQVNRLQHEVQGYKGKTDYNKEQRMRKRRQYVQPGDKRWNNAPPGAHEKNLRMRARDEL
mmetsp:Transcript_18183/g.23017  ORF Transcript_18183/g.23017 Transcript_18183/m.23017 type:complete len:89 (-) Transcript_18183:74-340(-)